MRNISCYIGIYWGFTLSLSNLYDINHGRSGVTLRTVSHQLSHLWEEEGLSAPHLLNYSQDRAQGFVVRHPTLPHRSVVR